MKRKAKTKDQLIKELEMSERKYERAETALKDVEFWNETLVENLPHQTFIKDKNGVYVMASANFARDLNLAPEAMKGKTDYDFFPKELAEKYRADDQRIMAAGEPEELEEIYVKDGQEVVVHTIKIPIKDKKANVFGILGHFWEVTHYKRAEKEAWRQNATLEAINKIFKETLRCETEEQLGKTILAVAEELTGSKFGFLGEINPTGLFDTIALSNPGWDACNMPQSNVAMLIKNMEVRGIWGRVIKDGKSLFTNEPDSHPDSVGMPKGHPALTAFLGAPLELGNRIIGMIALGNKAAGYNQADQEAIEAISMAASEALKNRRTEEKLSQQAQEIMELSTPVIKVWEGVVVAPLIGMLDSHRTHGFMERLLNGIIENNAPVALVDITGVPNVDTQTAQHLIEAINAARLLGTQVILTGVRPAIAQTIVQLGINLSEIETCASLTAGLRTALDVLGLEVSKKEKKGRV